MYVISNNKSFHSEFGIERTNAIETPPRIPPQTKTISEPLEKVFFLKIVRAGITIDNVRDNRTIKIVAIPNRI